MSPLVILINLCKSNKYCCSLLFICNTNVFHLYYLQIKLISLKSSTQVKIGKGKTLEYVKNNKEITTDYVLFNGFITEEKLRITIYKSIYK